MTRCLPLQLAACLVAFGTTGAAPIRAAPPDDADFLWAQKVMSAADGTSNPTVYTFEHDYFGSSHRHPRSRGYTGLVSIAGTFIATAGKGSVWCYDPVHRIAAYSEFGDVNGDTLAYADPPTARVKTSDLSHIVSQRGLRLGLAVGEVIRILRVTPHAFKRLTASRGELYVRTNVKCMQHTCSHDETIQFTNGRAVSISLKDVGP